MALSAESRTESAPTVQGSMGVGADFVRDWTCRPRQPSRWHYVFRMTLEFPAAPNCPLSLRERAGVRGAEPGLGTFAEPTHRLLK